MDVGFENAGVRVLVANEFAKDAAETYVRNHDRSQMIIDDIHNVLGGFNAYTNADFVFGGPPCQGFSVAGKMDPNDERSSLIFTFLDVVRLVQPRAFVMENVKALGILEKWQNVRNEFISRAVELGYSCIPFILDAPC